MPLLITTHSSFNLADLYPFRYVFMSYLSSQILKKKKLTWLNPFSPPYEISTVLMSLACSRWSNMSDWPSSVLKSALPARIRPATVTWKIEKFNKIDFWGKPCHFWWTFRRRFRRLSSRSCAASPFAVGRNGEPIDLLWKFKRQFILEKKNFKVKILVSK